MDGWKDGALAAAIRVGRRKLRMRRVSAIEDSALFNGVSGDDGMKGRIDSQLA